MNRNDIKNIARIAARGVELLAKAGVEVKHLDLMMDVEFCHDNDIPLDFEKFLAFDDGDFGHDIVGILCHFNREIHKLEDCFVPRCAFPEGGGS